MGVPLKFSTFTSVHLFRSLVSVVTQQEVAADLFPLSWLGLWVAEGRIPIHRFKQKGFRGGGGMDGKSGTSRCKLLYVEWMNSKVPLNSTGNYIQYPTISHNGKTVKKNIYVYVCITESFCCTPETNTTLYINCASVKYVKKQQQQRRNL